ncbi:hypothetical protein [Actinosynnema sp. NPDC020468]|uniref:hypothetical protein n=1 Tax=Actinosynnema sp. NPDC020468 TaxID=3154488 RepID=UPI0033CA9CA6
MPTTPARRPEPPGLLGYVLSDDRRTRNALLLLRWTLAGAVSALAVLAAAVVLLATHTPDGAWLYGGMSGLTAGGTAWYTHRRRTRRPRRDSPPQRSSTR